MNHDKLSADLLNRFIDRQMDAEERAETLELIHEDEALREQLAELHQVRERLRSAYAEPPEPRSRRYRITRGGIGAGAVAAMALLTVGSVGGWLAHDRWAPAAAPTAAVDHVAAAAAVEEARKVLLHISADRPERVAELLDDAERLLSRYAAAEGNSPVRLEVIANQDGVELLLGEDSPFGERVRRMVERYGEQRLAFLACGAALERLRLEGREVRLLPEAQVIPNALDRIVDRLRQGWAYIKV